MQLFKNEDGQVYQAVAYEPLTRQDLIDSITEAQNTLNDLQQALTEFDNLTAEPAPAEPATPEVPAEVPAPEQPAEPAAPAEQPVEAAAPVDQPAPEAPATPAEVPAEAPADPAVAPDPINLQ